MSRREAGKPYRSPFAQHNGKQYTADRTNVSAWPTATVSEAKLAAPSAAQPMVTDAVRRCNGSDAQERGAPRPRLQRRVPVDRSAQSDDITARLDLILARLHHSQQTGA